MASVSSKSLGTLIRIADSDGGAGDANYEIADINNFVSGGVVLVRKNIHSKSAFGSSTAYPGGTLDNKMTSIYNSLPEKLQSKIMDATFALEGSGSITRKVFALTYTRRASAQITARPRAKPYSTTTATPTALRHIAVRLTTGGSRRATIPPTRASSAPMASPTTASTRPTPTALSPLL